MRKKDKTCAKATPEEPKCEQRMARLMNGEELWIVGRYLEKYKITNESRWLRETIPILIHKNMEEDYPTLSGEYDMRRRGGRISCRLRTIKTGIEVNDNYYMRQALLEAQKTGDRGEVPVGTVVVCKDRAIVRAYDLMETLTDVTAHAEMQTITTAASTFGGKYLNECTLYVTVEPCVMYTGAIAWAQAGCLVFGAEDEERGYQRHASHALHPKTVVIKDVLGDERAVLTKSFFADKRR